jgi:hypothetical protein
MFRKSIDNHEGFWCHFRRGIRVLCFGLASMFVSAKGFAYDGICRTIDDVAELPPLHWCQVANSALESVEKKPNQYADFDGKSSASYDSFQRNRGVGAVTDGWSGAAFDNNRDRLIVWGGGHNGYGGNEIYAFDLKSLSWIRVTDPTTFPNRSPNYKNNDGTPISRHTYDGLTYISHTDELFAMGGAPDSAEGGCGVDGAWVFSFVSNTWTELRPGGDIPNTSCEDNAIYDPINKRVLYYKADIHALDREKNIFSLVSGEGWGQGRSLAIDPVRKLLVQVGANNDGSATRVANLVDLSAGFARLKTSGATKIESYANPGLTYDDTSDRVVGWYGGTVVYSLDPASHAWTAHSPANTNKATPFDVTTTGGVYGRFRYSARFNVFVVVNETNEPVYLYRLSDGTGIPKEYAPDAPGRLGVE